MKAMKKIFYLCVFLMTVGQVSAVNLLTEDDLIGQWKLNADSDTTGLWGHTYENGYHTYCGISILSEFHIYDHLTADATVGNCKYRYYSESSSEEEDSLIDYTVDGLQLRFYYGRGDDVRHIVMYKIVSYTSNKLVLTDRYGKGNLIFDKQSAPSPAKQIQAQSKAVATNKIYDLQGREVTNTKKEKIVIIDGKKYMSLED